MDTLTILREGEIHLISQAPNVERLACKLVDITLAGRTISAFLKTDSPRGNLPDKVWPAAEESAYQIAKWLGWPWLVPPTVFRQYMSQPTMAQVFMHGWEPPRGKPIAKHIKDRIKTLDYLIHNGDRHPGNLLRLSTWQVRAIDHTIAFSPMVQQPPEICKQPTIQARVAPFLAQRADYTEHLCAIGLPTEFVTPIFARAERILEER